MTDPNREPNVDESTIEQLEVSADELRQLALDLGLSPNNVNYWLVDHDEINQLAAYGGFQTRYPHWRWGMKYVERKKKDTYFGGKIFELVNHDEPSNAFLQESNSVQEQRSVIAHVEAHADFFANNQFFPNDPNAAEMLERHAEIISSYYEDPSIDYSDVESWIDAILCLENTIDQLSPMKEVDRDQDDVDDLGPSVEDKIESLDVSESVKRQVFEDLEDDDENTRETEKDVLKYLIKYGKQYDEDSERAVEYEDWQRTILKILRREAYYFSAQKMTKVMNEGWAAFWESIIMTNEGYAQDDEIIDYADKQSQVLNAPGLNPYKIGKEIWEYIENKENRGEVIDKLLRVDGITWRNFHDEIDFEDVRRELEQNRTDSVLCQKHYSLLRRQNLGFISNISQDELQRMSRYMFDKEKYDTIYEAIADVDYEAGWDRMREIRETHNDITFIDSFLTDEFIDDQKYFAYEFNSDSNQYEVSGTDLDSVKKKLLLQMTNDGKPTVIATDRNYKNAGELLLEHQYNGIPMDINQAKKVLERTFDLWGRPVNLKTIDKDHDGNEQGIVISYDGESTDITETDDIDHIRADEIDYDTKPSN